MSSKTATISCPGCGAIYPKTDEPTDRYGVSSPGCWAAFNELQAHERTLFGYPDIHRLIVDFYAVQHPPNLEIQRHLNISQRLIDASIQSVAVHLIALHFALVDKVELPKIAKLMGRILSAGADFPLLDPPEHRGKVTVADAPMDNDLEKYRDFAWLWAQEAWEAWSAHHPQIKAWVQQPLR